MRAKRNGQSKYLYFGYRIEKVGHSWSIYGDDFIESAKTFKAARLVVEGMRKRNYCTKGQRTLKLSQSFRDRYSIQSRLEICTMHHYRQGGVHRTPTERQICQSLANQTAIIFKNLRECSIMTSMCSEVKYYHHDRYKVTVEIINPNGQ